MAIVDDLLRNAYEDALLLQRNDFLGDNFSISREVDFLLIANDEKQGNTVCSFINDNQYGRARVDEADGQYTVLVQLTMPIEQNIVCSVSALMVCISHLFGVEYDGWGCELRKAAQPGIQADGPASGGSAA